jgi:hypothetical protein
MKKLSCILGLVLGLVLAAQPLWAQTRVGLRGGVNLARWHWSDDTDIEKDWIKNLPGLYIVAPVEIEASNHLAVQIEPAFIRKGVRLNYEESDETSVFKIDARTKLDYLSLDMLLKGKFGSDILQFYAVGGPGVAYATKGKITAEMTTGNGTITTEEESMDIDFEEANISRFDFGVLFGAGIEVPLGAGHFLLDARYNLGLQTLDTDDSVNSQEKIYNRGVMFSAGFMIPIGK